MKNNKRIAKIICSLCLWSLVLLCIVPFIWMVSASFKREADIFAVPFRLIPDYLNLQNFKEVWFGKYSYSLMFLNSAKVTLLSVGFAVTTSILAGYGFSKIKFPGRDKIFLLYLATMMIPSQVTLIPKFVMFNKMGLTGTHLTLILPGLITITGTFLMRQYFMQIPDELRESARVDGANEYVIWARIMVPIAKPSMASLAMVVFLWNWNSYLEPLVFLSDWRLYTIPIALTNFIEESVTEYNLVMAAAASALIPAFLVFIFGQKFLVKGLVSGAVKG